MRALSLLLLAALGSLPAAILSSANGNTLAGGTVTVTWDDATSASRTIGIVLPCCAGSGRIDDASNFDFRIDLETISNTWTLKNNRSGFFISSFEIDLTNAITGAGTAIFDSGTLPIAPGSNTNIPASYATTEGVIPAAGEPIAISAYLFSDQYTGDGGANMFRKLSVTLGSGLATGSTFSFNADTDLIDAVPEPSTWMTMGAAAALGLFVRRRRA